MSDLSPANLADAHADEIFNTTDPIDAVVIESFLLLDRHSRKAIMRRAKARSKAVHEALQIPDLTEARRLITSADWNPKTIWWCDTRNDVVAVLIEIYKHLNAHRNHSAAYVFNTLASRVGLLLMWDD